MEAHLRGFRNLVSNQNYLWALVTDLQLRAEHDQELDSLYVGPIPIGVNKFIFEADPPNLARLPSSEILGVTVILLTCSYDEREFVRVGYYVNNEYDSEELNADPPAKPIIERVRRNVLAEKPRVTRFAIKW
jgi:histone chaperone ASF1